MSDFYTFITGASSGMGETTAKLLSQSRNLLLSGRDEKRLASVAESCSVNGNKVEIFPYDLENCQGLAADLKSFLSGKKLKIDEFAHFAGMTEVMPMSKTTYKIGIQVMNVNYFSATEIISTLLKRRTNADALKKILLISSIVANAGKICQPHYCASKAAINALVKALAYELAPNIRINAIAPGSFKTRIMETLFYDPDAEWNPPTLLAPGTTEDIAKTARFLFSNDASYITGQIIAVDGGEGIMRL